LLKVTLLKESPFKLDIGAVAELYNHRSVIESRLVEWLAQAYQQHGPELESIPEVPGKAEGTWTVKRLGRMGIPARLLMKRRVFASRA